MRAGEPDRAMKRLACSVLSGIRAEEARLQRIVGTKTKREARSMALRWEREWPEREEDE